MKLGLELMAIICADGLNSEGELIDDVVYKINCAGLIVMFIDF